MIGKIKLLEDVAQSLERWVKFRSSDAADKQRPQEERAQQFEHARAVLSSAATADQTGPGSAPAQALTDYWLLDLGTGVQLDPRSTSSRWFLPGWSVDVNPRYQVNTGSQKGTTQFLVFRNQGGSRTDTGPLPEGPVRLRYRDSQGRGTSRGKSRINYTAAGDTVQLELPTARGLRSESTIVDRYRENFAFDQQGNVTGHEVVTVRRTRLQNTRSIPVDVTLHHHFEDQHWHIEDTSHPYRRVTYREVVFKRRLDAGEATSVRMVHRRFEGSRQD
jgi:hypothetical protein